MFHVEKYFANAALADFFSRSIACSIYLEPFHVESNKELNKSGLEF